MTTEIKSQKEVTNLESNLGKKLKSLRELRGFSLRELKSKTGISAAHLLLLENNKVRSPSPMMLKKLASAYDISFELLMKTAGYLWEDPEKKEEKMPRPVPELFKFIDDFSAQEIEELEKFIKFLRFKRKLS